MINRINIVTTKAVSFSDMESENTSMAKALEKYGFEVSLADWHDLYKTISTQKRLSIGPLLIRTVWDYPKYYDEFQDFIRLLREANIMMVNPANIIQWNIDKRYLFELQDAGFPIVPCEFVKAGSIVYGKNGQSVIKPVIGLGACGAKILNEGDSLIAQVDSLINPFRTSVYEGEVSVILISGKPVLFIRKIPASSDWRVQPEYGGKYLFESTMPKEVTDLAEKLYRYIYNRFESKYLLFMRVDMLRNDNSWEILEFEAIDPSLYGAVSSFAVDALAHSISSLYKS